MNSSKADRLFDRCWNDVRRVLIASPVPLTLLVIHERLSGYSFVYVQDMLRSMRVRGFIKRIYHGQGATRRVTYEWRDV